MENLFTINLDVLSSVVNEWRSFEATVRIRLKARVRRLNSKTWEHQRTSDSRKHLIDSSFKSLHTYTESELHPRANKSRARHATLILQQRGNTALSTNTQAAQSHTKPTDQVRYMKQGTQSWCTVTALRDGMGTHVHPWLIHVNVWQKPPQYWKVISLQLN